jgi:hypothetical protein
LFRQELLPKLAQQSAREIARATGMSVSYCAKIRRGEVVPHPRWWAVLEAEGVTAAAVQD